MHEVRKGYPEHFWLVVGHMAEAEDEMMGYSEEFANKIRDQRVKYQLEKDYEVPIMDLIEEIGNLEQEKKPERTQETISREKEEGPFRRLT
jgi:hypothetical protein